MKNLIRKELIFKVATPQEGDDANFIIRGVFSTPDMDRHDEQILQNGWDLKAYLTNPVILFAHDQYTPAVGKAIEIGLDEKGNLSGAIQFAVNEFELAATLYKLYKGGFMRAFSVGFENSVYEEDRENDALVLKENILYEISCVNVPANAMALANSKGIDTKSIEDCEAAKKLEAEKELEKELAAYEEKVLDEIRNTIKSEISNLRNDNHEEKLKVETRTVAGAKMDGRNINKAIRQLILAKKNLKK
jgi:HK97 family phage prohead protease